MAGHAYKTKTADCDVREKKSLESFRALRVNWLSALRHDPENAISDTVVEMVWADMRFRTLAKAGELFESGAMGNSLLAEALIEGHFATQALAVRRLLDASKNVISLPKVIQDMDNNIDVFTRENFVCFDGLPYDYETVRDNEFQSRGSGVFALDQEGPNAWATSERAHRAFDALCGVAPDARQRHDRMPRVVLERLRLWLKEADADTIVAYADNFLAHGRDSRKQGRLAFADVAPNLPKITNAGRCFVRVAEALLAHILFDSGHGQLVPTPQFDTLEFLDRPVYSGERKLLDVNWISLERERNGYIDGLLEALVAKGP